MKSLFHSLHIALYLLLFGATTLYAQQQTGAPSHHFGSDNISFYGQNSFEFILKRTPYLIDGSYMTYDVAVDFDTLPTDTCSYASAYGFPTIGFGISVSNLASVVMEGSSHLSDIYTVYGSFERPLVRGDRLTWGFRLEGGLTTTSLHFWDPVDNPGNEALTSRFMANASAGLFAKYHIGKRWEVGASLMYRHYSNGRLSIPNAGLDILGGGIFARWRMNDYHPNSYPRTSAKPLFNGQGLVCHLSLGGGVHSCQTEWRAAKKIAAESGEPMQTHFPQHPKMSLTADLMYRYALKYASGMGLDLYWSSNMRQLRESDLVLYGKEAVESSEGYDPFSLGVSVHQEIYWRNCSLYVAFGSYLHRQKGIGGDRGKYYERAGVRYYHPRGKGAFVGLTIKAHRFVAEYLEFSTGFRFG